ncbi:MAG: non-homologous end-joining DNA ligase, partial [Limisphaerales bacterium]
VRALAIKRNRQLAFRSRSDNDLRSKYPPILAALERLPVTKVVLDGEVVAVDDHGRSSFQLLQSYQSAPGRKPHLFYYVFDILNLNGRDLIGLPLWQRKQLAEKVVADLGPAVRFSDSIRADSARVVREMQKRGLEGLVAKRRDSRYESGQRTGAWVKFKWTREQEFVIGGYTEPKGSRSHFGAILVGYYEGGKLLFAAKVGTGFDQRVLASLYEKFQKLRRKTCPFANLPEDRGLTAAQMRRCSWLAPELVCQIRFSEWTRDGHLRQPAFLGLREDKSPREVTREIPR